MNLFLTKLSEAAADSIPERPAETSEALKLMGIGWGSIFIVIAIIMATILLLNYVFKDRRKNN